MSGAGWAPQRHSQPGTPGGTWPVQVRSDTEARNHHVITLHLDGRRVRDIPSFYDEVNRVFMSGEDWRLGESLDALDDLLYGGYGALHGHEQARVVWEHHEHAASALGLGATRAQLVEKLAAPQRYDQDLIRRRLAQLDADGGPTYFATVREIFGGHPGIELVLA